MATSIPPFTPLCASCHGPGNFPCSGCHLVTYCSNVCQKTHWKTHKRHCKSPLGKHDWQPEWAQQQRQPAFVGGSQRNSPVIPDKWLWGNTPSIDVLKLDSNEGAAYQQDLKVLFAASGDIRNVVATVSSLPGSYVGKMTIIVNDVDFHVAARNVVILLLALKVSDHQQAAEAIIHCWYSAFLRPADFQHIESLRQDIQEVCDKISGRASGSLQAKNFTFDRGTLRVILRKEAWKVLLGFVSVSPALTPQKAFSIRCAVTLAPGQKDYRERALLFLQPGHRICKQRFREDGILLPFGHSRDDFTIPNPTLYQNNEWQLSGADDPITGWSLAQILQTDVGAASKDVYGKLYVHIRARLFSFIRRLSNSDTEFEIHNWDATQLPSVLGSTQFARIDTSNISDEGFLGMRCTVSVLSPLLQRPSENPHATLITSLVNAVKDYTSKNPASMEADYKAVSHYRRVKELQTGNQFTDRRVKGIASDLSQDVEKPFSLNARVHEFERIARETGMRMKEPHTVVDKWPARPKLRPGQEGAEEEFAIELAAAYNSYSRYVEWAHAT